MKLQSVPSDVAKEGVDADYAMYRSLSGKAVVGLIFGLFGLVAILTPWLVFLPVLGFIFSVQAMRAIRQLPAELTGRGLAWTGLAFSAVGVGVGIGLNAYVYATEVPEGFSRISFGELQPSQNPKENHPLLGIPQAAIELDGDRVFIKGYVYPDGRKDGIRHFILVPDMGTCCFGGDPKLTDMIEVRLQDDLTIEYSYSRRKLAGTFSVNFQPTAFMDKMAVYHLEAEWLK